MIKCLLIKIILVLLSHNLTAKFSPMNIPDLLWMPGGGEITAILVIVVLLFGAKKIPELMKGVGKGIKEFKNATAKEETNEEKRTARKARVFGFGYNLKLLRILE